MYSVLCTVYNARYTIYNTRGMMFAALRAMYDARYTMYDVRCTMYDVRCTMYNVQCIVYTVLCIWYNKHCSLYHIHTLNSVQWKLYVHCAICIYCKMFEVWRYTYYYIQYYMCIIHCALYTVQCRIHTFYNSTCIM